MSGATGGRGGTGGFGAAIADWAAQFRPGRIVAAVSAAPHMFVPAGLCALAGALAVALAITAPVSFAEPPREVRIAAVVLHIAAIVLRARTINRLTAAMRRGADLPPAEPDMTWRDALLLSRRRHESVERAHARYHARTSGPASGLIAFGGVMLLGSVFAGEARGMLVVLGATISAAGLGFWSMRDCLATRGDQRWAA